LNRIDNFIVLDTEGRDTITEIAILNHQGQLIYEAVGDNVSSRLACTSLASIIEAFRYYVQSHWIVCHYAEHDIQVLKNTFQAVGQPWPELRFLCSYELAQQYFPKLNSYSLAHLSRVLNLTVDKRYFNEYYAHSARYDAQFTYQLFIKIQRQHMKADLAIKPNPFGTSRVDTPFQNHIDFKDIYTQETAILKSLLHEIKADENHQSRGTVVIGEAGSGKTHLMMRLAQELLASHRLLFIRQPNHPQSVLYHIYSRILESLVEVIPQRHYSQLEYLLAKSFSQIVIKTLLEKDKPSKKDETFIELLSADHLNIYNPMLGAEGSDKKRNNWRFIEKRTLEWWHERYGFSGYGSAIIRGLIKYCYYSDTHKRALVRRWLAGHQLETQELAEVQLDNWGEELSQEDFSLEAISVFGKLSIVDEPLIIIFDQLEGLKYHESLLLNFGEALKELFTHVANSLIILNVFPDRWIEFKQILNPAVIDRIAQHEVVLTPPAKAQLKQILTLRAQAYQIDTLEALFDEAALEHILTQPSIRSVLNWASHYYRHNIHDVPLPQIAKSDTLSDLQTTVQQLKQDIEQLKQHVGLNTQPQAAPAPQAIPSPAASSTDSEAIVLDYLSRQRALLEQNYHKKVIISDSDDLGKLITITQAFKMFTQIKTDYLRLGKRKLPEHLEIITPTRSFVVAFLHLSGGAFVARLKNFNQLVLDHKDKRFRVFRDAREPPVTGKVSKDEIEKLNNTEHGNFYLLEKDERIEFELIYQLIVDEQNRDLDTELEIVLPVLYQQLGHHWLIKILKQGQ